MANEVTSADGGWRVLFASRAQWPATAEFLRWTTMTSAMTPLFVGLTLMGWAQLGRAASPTLTLAEQEVVGLVLQREGPSATSGTTVMLDMASVSEIRHEQSHEEFAKRLRSWGFGEKERPSEIQQALEDFLAKNRTDTQIVFPTNASAVRLVPETVVDEIFRTNGWRAFYQQFPGSGGYAVVSRVGFDSKKTVAMVYLGVHRGSLSGRGRIYILRREHDQWTITYESIGPEWAS